MNYKISINTHLGKMVAKTIAAGVITITSKQCYIDLDTESAASTDDLVTINGGIEGQIIVLKSVSASRDPTLKETGNLNLATDFTLTSSTDSITLFNRGNSTWIELSRSDNT